MKREAAAVYSTRAPSAPAPQACVNGTPQGREDASLDSLLQSATARLQNALALARREARLEAHILAARALDADRAWLVGHGRDLIDPLPAAAFESLVARRERGEPVAYILGEKEFYGRTFKVTPDVLIPRPDTELLVETALALPGLARNARVLDLGTGSGCIGITLARERPDWSVTAVDVSPDALAVAADNARRLGMSPRFAQSDFFSGLADERYDLIVSNPPYIEVDDPHLGQGDVRFEPDLALVSGADGLDALRVLCESAPRHLAAGGWLLVEHGWRQADSARELMAKSGLENIASLPDLAGHLRVTLSQWMPRP